MKSNEILFFFKKIYFFYIEYFYKNKRLPKSLYFTFADGCVHCVCGNCRYVFGLFISYKNEKEIFFIVSHFFLLKFSNNKTFYVSH